MPDPVVAVVGLNALKRDLVRAAGDRGPINAAFSAAGTKAIEPVAAAARAAVPHDSGELAGTIRVTGSRSGGTVRMGNAGHRYAGWVDFGGTRKRPHIAERPYLTDGRYLFPAARGLSGAALAAYTPALQSALDAMAWTNTTTEGSSVHD